jgi:hypothetical protein
VTDWICPREPMTSLSDCLVAFLGGAVSEAMCLWWVAAAEKRRAGVAALFSMGYAVAIERGVGEAIHTLPGEVSFVLGFGFGTFAAVHLRRWIARDS